LLDHEEPDTLVRMEKNLEKVEALLEDAWRLTAGSDPETWDTERRSHLRDIAVDLQSRLAPLDNA